MAKGRKLARVRYDNGKESGKEQYVLEIWHDDVGAWGEVMATRFVADAKHPETGEEFVHYTLVIEIIKLVTNGYSIEI